MKTKRCAGWCLSIMWLTAAVGLLGGAAVHGAEDAGNESAAAAPSPEQLRAGWNFMPTTVYSAEDDQRLLRLFEGLRVADVCDGMDRVGLRDTGLVSPDIRPLWRDTKHFRHRIIGIAVTVRYVPTNKPALEGETDEEFGRAVGRWYGQLSPEPFVTLLRNGSVLVIEGTPGAEAGTIGSNNIMGWVARGCVGVVTNATARDTDEIITEGVPLYYRHPGRGIRPGRNEVESVNRPVAIGGVLVRPGDVVVADGDGVIVVPREQAEAVAHYANWACRRMIRCVDSAWAIC